MQKVIAILLVLGAVAATSTYIRPVTYAPRSDAYYLTKRNFTDGTSSLGNALSTIWTGWKQTRPVRHIEMVSGDANVIGNTIHAATTSTVQINTLYYPGWSVRIDNKAVQIKNVSGVIQVTVSKGTHTMNAVFGETVMRMFADAVSLASLVYLGYTILQVYAHSHNPQHRPAF